MPNRIIKESICTSDSIESLSDFHEAFFYRLIVNCDDYGRMDARPAILKARLYPLRDRVSLKDIQKALKSLSEVGCIELYEVNGKPYLFLPSWEKHQQIRAKRSKFPEPDNSCIQLISDDSKCPRNPIQSESQSESESECVALCAEPETVTAPPAIFLPLNDGTDYPVSQEQCHEWAGLYPAVDVIQQLRNMRGWLDGNPTKRKTKRGIVRFITGWLAREQDRGWAKNNWRKEAPKKSWEELAREMEENGEL